MTIRLMLVCGEPSGDALGAQLMGGLKALAGIASALPESGVSPWSAKG